MWPLKVSQPDVIGHTIYSDIAIQVRSRFLIWIVKRKDEKLYDEYRTKRVILEMYDEMKRAMEMEKVYRTRLEPGPEDGSGGVVDGYR